MKKKFFRDGLVGYLQKILLLSFIAIIIAIIISYLSEIGLKNILGYMGLGLISIGGLSALGSGSISMDDRFNQERVTANPKSTNKSVLEGVADSYRFTIFMLSAGGIVALISLLF